MMRRMFLAVAIGGVCTFGVPQPARCDWCSGVPCYGTCGGSPGCVCVIPPESVGPGRCYSITELGRKF